MIWTHIGRVQGSQLDHSGKIEATAAALKVMGRRWVELGLECERLAQFVVTHMGSLAEAVARLLEWDTERTVRHGLNEGEQISF